LTRLYFDGFQKKPAILSTNCKRGIIAGVSHDRLDLIPENHAAASKRLIVRLPVEVKYVEFLSKLKGFSSENIAEIIGLKLDSIETRSNRGFRLLQLEPFTFGGHD
jgi:DNA-directed RNA polymerase specialized sigma24 family protein